MSDWETYTGGDGNSAAFDDGWDPDGGNDSDDWNPDEGNDMIDYNWNPEEGNGANDDDDWNPDGGNPDENNSDDWNPDGDNESQSDRPDDNQNDDNDGEGFWDSYFGDNEYAAGLKREEDTNDESKSEHNNDKQKDDDVASHESNNFFAKDENDEWEGSNNDSGVEDFYNEASKRKQPVPAPPLSPGSHHSSEVSLSQQSHALSQHSNISAAELSRMEEDLLSQTSHREEEMKRQDEKQKRRERRQKGETSKKHRKPLSEEQKEYRAAYHRMKYRKKVEMSEELDTSGSFAYLSTRKLREENEQKRLKGLAWERERIRRSEMKQGKDSDEVATSKQDSQSTKSKWSADGYAALPTSQARELPFFVYTKRPRSCSNSQMESDTDNSLGSDNESIGEESDENESKKKKAKNQLLIEDDGVEIKGMDIVRKYKPTSGRKRSQQLKSNIVGSFPLRHNRTKSKLGFSNGSEQMVWAQGRNAKRLWARMIASNGVGIASNQDVDKSTKDTKDDESSSSQSINSSHNTQSPDLTAATGKHNDDHTNNIRNESNQLLRLTRQIHELPKTTHRQHFSSSVTNELGRNRHLWEECLREWVERNDYFSPEKQCAIKYFLGVDGDITSGSFGFILNTHPRKFVGASRRLRHQLLSRFNRWVQQRQSDPNHKSENEATDEHEIFDPMANINDHEEAGFDADDVNIIFNSNIDVFSIASTLSYFLDQLSLAKKRYENVQQMDLSSLNCIRLAEGDIQRWQKIISSFLATANVESKPTQVAFVKASTTEYQFPLFKAIAAQHSYISNGSCLELVSRKQEKGESDSDSDIEGGQKQSHEKVSREDLEKKELRQIGHSGKEIFQSTRGHINNEGLAVFTSIRLTIGISTITEFLPPSATEILSRQTYSGMNADETPFGLIRLMLAHLEERDKLVSRGYVRIDKSERPIVDESLADAMHVAIRFFHHCKELEPKNLQYWSWYVAAVCGRLCIASGTSLSDNANASERKRQQLPCFSEARAEASCAVDEIIQRSKSEDCPMFFFAVTSMLEWKRAMILLHRHALFSTVNRLHAYTTYQWAAKCCSKIAVSRVQSLYDNMKIPLDALLDVLARQVEQNACDMKRWSMLVTALGGVGTAADAKCNSLGKCSDACNALQDGLCFNHTLQQERKEDTWWWGKSRASDWESTFFVAPECNTTTSQDFVCAVLDASSSAHWKSLDRRKIITARISNQEASLPDDPQDCMDWLFDEEEGDNDIDIDLSHECLLPGNHLTSNTILTLGKDQLETSSKIRNKQMRALSLKVIVACHLLGVWHPFVSNSIWWLSVKAHASNLAACESLHWLAIHGLDIQVYIQKRGSV